MKRYTFGAERFNLDPWGIRTAAGPASIVEAEGYRIDRGFVTFYRDGADFLSLPHSRVALVAELDAENGLPLTYQEAGKPTSG